MSQPFEFPDTILDNPEALLAALGSLWDNTYQGNDLVYALCAAKLAQQKQAYQNGSELLAACNRLSVPIYHTENWLDLTLVESEVNIASYALAEFGDEGLSFSPNSSLQFGVPLRRMLYAWAVPAGLTAVPLLFNRITTPSITLVDKLDYVIREGFIIFRDNPFDNDAIPKSIIFTANEPTDRHLVMWGFKTELDKSTVYEQFGYVLGLQLPSSQNYKNFVNALFDALVAGSTAKSIKAAWSAITGVPFAAGTETVEVIISDVDRTLIITDKTVYNFDPSVVVTVDVGDTVNEGDELTDAVQFFELNRGQCPSVAAATIVATQEKAAWAVGHWAINEWLAGQWFSASSGTASKTIQPEGFALNSLALGRGLLAAGFFGDLVFRNADAPLVATEDSEGFTKVSWALGGWPGDIELFFDQLHARGLAGGQTIAHLLDKRPVNARDTEPTAGSLPATINPLQFLCENVLRDNAFLVKVKNSAVLNGIGLNSAKLLRRVIPPQTVMIVISEIDFADAPLTMDGPGDSTKPGYEELVSVFNGMNISESINPNDYITENVSIYQISGRCS